MPSKVFLIQSEGLGRGDDQLGTMLMANFYAYSGRAKRNLRPWFFGIPESVWFVKTRMFWAISNGWKSRVLRYWPVLPVSNILSW